MLWPDDSSKMSGEDDVDGNEPGASSHTYGPYSMATAQAFIDKVKNFGMTVAGSNPWTIAANQHGITLAAIRDASGNVIVEVLSKNFYVSNAKIWEKIDPLMPKPDAVVGDDATRWDKLASQLEALDAVSAPTLHTTSGRVIGFVGEDWTPPLSTDPEAHVKYLEDTYQHVTNALDTAKQVGGATAEKIKSAASSTVDTAKGLASDVATKTQSLEKGLHDRAVAVKDKLVDTAKDLAPWYVGIGIGAWCVIGVGVWLYLKSKEPSRRPAGENAGDWRAA